MTTPPLERALATVPRDGRVLDFGCLGWRVHHAFRARRPDIQHAGCDVYEPEEIPDNVRFLAYDDDAMAIASPDDEFDLVVVSHVLEHVPEPVRLFAELVRVCRPGGRIYVEAPSDRACHTRSDRDVESHTFFSFWDDPTHVRPWTPAAFYRLAISYGCEPEFADYLGDLSDKVAYVFKALEARITGDKQTLTEYKWRAHQWACAAVIRKPMELRGRPEYVFVSLRDVRPGVRNALQWRAKHKRR